MTPRTTIHRSAALALAAASAIALTACGSNDSAGDSASKAVDAASSAASAAGTDASSVASDAATDASNAASDAGTAASNAATDATSAVAGAAGDASSAASSGASNASSAANGEYSLADVKKHATESDCWAAIKAPGESTTGVYNLTSWVGKHPGGPEVIKGLCGTDATSKFLGKHGEDGAQGEPEQRLAAFKVGTLKG